MLLNVMDAAALVISFRTRCSHLRARATADRGGRKKYTAFKNAVMVAGRLP